MLTKMLKVFKLNFACCSKVCIANASIFLFSMFLFLLLFIFIKFGIIKRVWKLTIVCFIAIF